MIVSPATQDGADKNAPCRHAPRGMQALVVACLALAVAIATPFAGPLVLGGALAASCLSLCDSMGQRLQRLGLTKGRRLAPMLCSFGLLTVLLAPFVLTGSLIAADIRSGIDWVKTELDIDSVSDLSTLQVPPELQERAQPVMERLHLSSDTLRQSAVRLATAAKPVVAAVLGTSVTAPAFLALTLMVFYFCLADGRRLVQLVREILPMGQEEAQELIGDLHGVARATVVGNLTTALVQTGGLGVAFWLAQVPHPTLFALIALPASFIPVAGSALVYVPVGLGLAIASRYVPCICLLAGCAALSSLNTNVIKPLVVRGGIPMHTGLIFLSILGGIKLFGMIGLIAGPLGMGLARSMVIIYRRRLVEGQPLVES